MGLFKWIADEVFKPSNPCVKGNTRAHYRKYRQDLVDEWVCRRDAQEKKQDGVVVASWWDAAIFEAQDENDQESLRAFRRFKSEANQRYDDLSGAFQRRLFGAVVQIRPAIEHYED